MSTAYHSLTLTKLAIVSTKNIGRIEFRLENELLQNEFSLLLVQHLQTNKVNFAFYYGGGNLKRIENTKSNGKKHKNMFNVHA